MERPEIASTDGTSEIASTTDGKDPSGLFAVPRVSHPRNANDPRDDRNLDSDVPAHHRATGHDRARSRRQLLKAHADRIDAWPTWRTRALEATRASIVEELRAARPIRHRWETPTDGSSLVRIYLWEGELEPAWQEAGALGCTDALWRELAVKREPDHPADALPIYQREVNMPTTLVHGERPLHLLGRALVEVHSRRCSTRDARMTRMMDGPARRLRRRPRPAMCGIGHA